MDYQELTEEEMEVGQQKINQWLDNLPNIAAECLAKLEKEIPRMETFDLLSNIAVYNHLHDSQSYTDYRGDKLFVIPELAAMISLKENYVPVSQISAEESGDFLIDVQKHLSQFHSLMGFHMLKARNPKLDHSIDDIASRFTRDETNIRNPGFPEHHLEFSGELYQRFEQEIKSRFGFSIKESILIRECIVKLINFKLNTRRLQAEDKALELAMSVYKFRRTGAVPANCEIEEKSLVELNKLSRSQIKSTCHGYAINEMFYRLGSIYSFTPGELAEYTHLDILTVESFLKTFSCNFLSVPEDADLISPVGILTTKPLIEHGGRYLLPSAPLLTWCVEPVIEEYIKQTKKLQDRFQSLKHDFLLKKGSQYLMQVFQNKIKILTNLFYYESDNLEKQCETDGIFIYNRTLFILEAKGNRFTRQAKEGNTKRTEQHLKDIIKNSYGQAIRTLDHVQRTKVSLFYTKEKRKVEFRKDDFDECIIISLAMEPIGNLTPLIRVTNELGYFKEGIFPWIISLYDLIVVADHIELPTLLIHFIKRRKEFLQRKLMHVFEELDLLGYYLKNRLFIEDIYNDAVEKDKSIVYMDNCTDEINNYYVQKHRDQIPNPPKLKLNVSENISGILISLETSNMANKKEIMMLLMDLPPGSTKKLSEMITLIKGKYYRDGQKHDCAIITEVWGKKVGFGFMAGPDKSKLNGSLFEYCNYKLNQTGTDIWIGIGDIEKEKSSFNIQATYIARPDIHFPLIR